jgi:HSP20 family protein
MSLIRFSRWEPYRDMMALTDRLQHAFGDLTPYSPVEGVGAWLPPVDIIEETDRLIFKAEIPGVNRDDLEIQVENGTLILRGEKKQEKELRSESAHRIERYYGGFSRSFVLPTSIARERITATYTDGVLQVVLPKADEAKPRKIAIQGA